MANENPVRNILVLLANPICENEFGRFIKVFSNLNDLDEYVCAHIKDANNFHLHISGLYLEELIEKCLHKIKEVRCIYVYHATDDTLQSDKIRFSSGSENSEKLEFHLERDLQKQLENAETGGAVDPLRPVDRTTIGNIATLKIERLHAKRTNSTDCHSPEPKRFASTVQNDFFMNNIGLRFICPSCKVLFQEPYQLEYGHRLCKSCVNIENNCAICSKFITKDKAWFDRGFQNEKQHLLTTCLECEWTGSFKHYEGHLNQNHQTCSNHSISNEQVAQSNLHQQILSSLRLVRLANNSNLNNNHIQRAVFTLSNTLNVLNNDIQRMNGELGGYQNCISVVAQQLPLLKTLAQEINDRIPGIEINQKLLYQEYLSLKERVEDVQAASFDGTLTWKIANFLEKRMNAEFGGPKSIYSPPFYSSPTGYKMCLRLFLNGDSNTRGTHMSLYLVILRGNYDPIVHWPFNFKIKFTLLNQFQSDNNQSNFFWSDPTSICFQRPNTNMNIPYGISKFFPLNVLKQNENHYVRDNTMLVTVELDFLAKISEMSSNGAASELMNDGEYNNITDNDISVMTCHSDNFNDAQ